MLTQKEKLKIVDSTDFRKKVIGLHWPTINFLGRLTKESLKSRESGLQALVWKEVLPKENLKSCEGLSDKTTFLEFK